jgi:CHAD domain-containing protein
MEYDLILKREPMNYTFEINILNQLIEDALEKKEAYINEMKKVVDQLGYIKDNVQANDYQNLLEKINFVQELTKPA